MKHSLQDNPEQVASLSLNRPWRFLDLFRGASSRTLTLTAIAVAVAWVPPALLSALRGGATFLSFLTDWATQSRFLIIVPVLILAEPKLYERLAVVADHFERFFVPQKELAQFQTNWTSFSRLRHSKLAKVLIVLLTYAIAAWLLQFLRPGGLDLISWEKDGGGMSWLSLSPAGMWLVFISYAILVYLTILWLWRQVLWTRFLRSTTRLDLRLIAAHPDRLGGLGFLETSLRGQVPFSFCLGAGLSGAVANRIFHEGQKLTSFSHVAIILVAAVFLFCVTPYFFFISTLMRMRRSGMLHYGAFARALGEQFEKKWLDRADRLGPEDLNAVDFSATNDLYGVFDNINGIRVIPVSRVDLYALVGGALVPAIPVVIGSIPFNIVMQAAVKLLF